MTRTDWDALDRVVATIDRVGATVGRGYDETSAVSDYDDPRALQTEFVRNGFGDVVEERSPDRGVRRFYYDERGLMVRAIDGRGVETAYAYDAAGDLVAKTYPAAGSTLEDVLVTRGAVGSGPGAGLATRIDHPAGATRFAYAADGRLARLSRDLGAQTYDVDMVWTAGDRLSRLAYPSGRVVDIVYDAAGQPSRIETAAASGGPTTVLASAVAYAPMGPIERIDYGNGLVHTAAFDLSYRLVEQRDQFGVSDLRRIAYAFDANDNLVSATDLVGPGVEAFTYDAEDRLATASGGYGLLEYAYDGVGNRIELAATPPGGARDVASFVYPTDSNRLTSVSTGGAPLRQFAYDGNGNSVSETVAGTVWDYGYTLADRLASVDRDGVRAAEYAYDHDGQLAARRLFDAAGAPTAEIHTVHDVEGRRIAEHDAATGAVLREYVWLDDRPLAAIDATGAVYWVHIDWIHRPAMMTDATGAEVWRASWTPFGGADVVLDETANTLRFPGQWFQLETGLHHNWRRDYDPTLGRYLQPDRLGLIDGPSVYGYAGQNPIGRVDPTGEYGLVGFAAGFFGNLAWQYFGEGKSLQCISYGEAGLSGLGGALGGGGVASFFQQSSIRYGGLIRGADLSRVSSWRSASVRSRLRYNNGIQRNGNRNRQIVHIFIPDKGWGSKVSNRVKGMRWNLGIGDASVNSAAGTRTTWDHFVQNYPLWSKLGLGAPNVGGMIDALIGAFGSSCGCRR